MGVLDWVLSVGAVVLMFARGWWFSRSQMTTEDYFAGDQRMNWLAVGLVMFATTFSPLSFPPQAPEAGRRLSALILPGRTIPLPHEQGADQSNY
jgi:hypothetical protein